MCVINYEYAEKCNNLRNTKITLKIKKTVKLIFEISCAIRYRSLLL